MTVDLAFVKTCGSSILLEVTIFVIALVTSLVDGGGANIGLFRHDAAILLEECVNEKLEEGYRGFTIVKGDSRFTSLGLTGILEEENVKVEKSVFQMDVIERSSQTSHVIVTQAGGHHLD